MNPLQWNLAEWGAFFAIIVSISSLVIQLTKVKNENKEKEASFAQLVTEAAKNLIAPLNERIEGLESTVTSLTSKVKELTAENVTLKTTLAEISAGVEILSNQIIALGHKPKWTRRSNKKTSQ